MKQNRDRLGEYKQDDSGKKQFIILDVELEKVDLERLYEALTIVSEYNRVKNIYNMTIRNANDLYRAKQLSSNNLYVSQSKLDSTSIIMEMNKAIFNYCSSIGMYIDIIEKSLSKIDKTKIDNFRKECSRLYDTKLEYRFFVIMRNYILHYDLPFTVHKRTLSNSEVVCLKEHLLKFKNWKHVKKDIENMSEEIDIISMINEMNVSLTILWLEYQYLISKNIMDSLEIAIEFMKKYDVSNPFIVKNYSLEAFKDGKINMNQIGIGGLISIVKELNNHPHININFN